MAVKQKVVMKIPMNGQNNNKKALQAVTKAKGIHLFRPPSDFLFLVLLPP
ncbi:hypothetical protein QJS04_geneDACA013818 [Acorus gramineus]|uniref:Uncharacterized protein n=1 Tax=Acorus gramineus TaxID=55184 RepID=A0AAV9AZW8_ACOGR|nr:hypothetical protein QJS04_geneDACA013818 [Acorus gramineus]